MSVPQPFRVADLTRDEFAAAMRDGRWLLLPLGSTEQHGPHLPLGTDFYYAEHVCRRVAERVNALVAPGLPYGICHTMRNFAGTVSLSVESFVPLLREILSEYVRHGARKVALIAGHAEEAQDAAVREAVLPLVNADPSLAVLAIGPYAFLDPIRREADLVGTDGHAGSIETSEMLAIAPDLVHSDRIPRVTRPPLSRFLIAAHPEQEYPTGVRGDTSKVSSTLGERALDHTISEIVRLLRNIESHGSEWGEHVKRNT
ncbi:MAG: creatininase family protein [candidate division NC10 bacterium]|nr:creatininase family protein [candidate division NC10 bacterium]